MKGIDLSRHFHEKPPESVRQILRKNDSWEHKVAIWNAFVDSDLSGITDADCAILPRVLPACYLPAIQSAAHDVTLFAMRFLSQPEREIRAMLPSAPIRDFLISELQVLKRRPERLVGSFRFDMAVVGPPESSNPPKLLEINEIGFDGIARSSFIQETLFRLLPKLRQKLFALDTATAEVKNIRRLGREIARFQYETYNWEEEVLMQTAKQCGVNLRLISPKVFGCKIDKSDRLLSREHVILNGQMVRVGSGYFPDAFQMGYSFTYKDYLADAQLLRILARSKTRQYSPFISGLVASKMFLTLLSDPSLRKRFLGQSRKLESTVLPATSLQDGTGLNTDQLAMKHADGLGGEQVYVGREIRSALRKIKPKDRAHWMLQKRIRLNTIDVHGILSRPRRVISDLGVFVQYDWQNNRFNHFGVGGLITRGTNRSLKVNVSGGGIQVPVMFCRSTRSSRPS